MARRARCSAEVVEKLRSEAGELEAEKHIHDTPDQAAGLERPFEADVASSVVDRLDVPAVAGSLDEFGHALSLVSQGPVGFVVGHDALLDLGDHPNDGGTHPPRHRSAYVGSDGCARGG